MGASIECGDVCGCAVVEGVCLFVCLMGAG